MLYKCKSNHTLLKGKDPSIKGKDVSLLQLTTLSNFLEGEQGLAQDITKEIVPLLPSRKTRYTSARRMNASSTSP